jgi:hypothetical protein
MKTLLRLLAKSRPNGSLLEINAGMASTRANIGSLF